MANLLPKKGYKLKYIYHSNSKRQIVCTSLRKLIEEKKFFVSMFLSRSMEKKGVEKDPTKLKNVKKMIKMFSNKTKIKEKKKIK